MIRINDLNTFHEVIDINDSSVSPPNIIGRLINDFEIHQVTDVRGLSVRKGFIIDLKQRIIVPSALTAESATGGYKDYPAYFINTVTPQVKDDETIELIHYSPITLNSSVEAAVNNSVGLSQSDSTQYTSGSSSAVTNSFEVSVNLSENGGIGGGYTNSTTNTTEHSLSAGSDKGNESQTGATNSMSIKEWASYLSIDVSSQAPTWTWTQEFPWNPYQYAADADGGHAIALPPFISNRLLNRPDPAAFPDAKPTVLPPSALSLHGLSFVSKARWLYFPKTSDTIIFEHGIEYSTASHGIDTTGQKLTVSMKKATVQPASKTTIPTLSAFGLAALGTTSVGGIMTFAPSQFITRPSSVNNCFSAASPNNEILVQGSGFELPPNSDFTMVADVTKTGAKLKVLFKVTDLEEDCSLYLKHWKVTENPCVLQISVNGGPKISRHVDAGESASGATNVLRLILRKLDYNSTDFYDYLVPGANVIEIDISSGDLSGVSICQYALRSLVVL